MDVTFFQQWTVKEHILGSQTLTFILSNNYDNLFKAYADITGNKYEVNCFNLQDANRDLNQDNNQFSVDELNFSISHASCGSMSADSSNLKALFYCLEASDTTQVRFVAMHFGQPSLDNALFTGMIKNKISGTEKGRVGGLYARIVNPLRDYKFSAQSFDVSLLEKTSYNGKIEAVDGSLVDNIRTKMSVNDWAVIKSKISCMLSYITKEVPDIYGNATTDHIFYYERNKINLFDLIQEILDLSAECIQGILLQSSGITFELLPSDLGFDTYPCFYDLIDPNVSTNRAPGNYHPRLYMNGEFKNPPAIDNENKVRLWIKPGTYITEPEIDPVGKTAAAYVDESFISMDLIYNVAYQTMQNDKSNTLFDTGSAITNTAEMLYEIARATGTYVVFRLESGLKVKIQFTSKNDTVSDEIYVIGVTSGDFNTANTLLKEANTYHAYTSHLTCDGLDVLQSNYTSKEGFFESKKHIEKSSAVEKLKKKKNIDSKKLILTTGPTYRMHESQDAGLASYRSHLGGLNLLLKKGAFPYLLERYTAPISGIYKYLDNPNTGGSYGWFTNALFIGYFSNPNKEQWIYDALNAEGLSGNALLRPAAGVVAKIGDEDKAFETLTDYISFLFNHEIQYYETEYNFTVPYWHGFSKNSDGSSPSIKNLKLGSKIRITETIENYISATNSWTQTEVTRTLVVVGINYNLQKPEIKMKLHSLERFSISDYNGTAPNMVPPPAPDAILYDPRMTEQRTVAAGETILAYDAVKVLADGTIVKATPKQSQGGHLLGVVLQEGSGGDILNVITSGKVIFPDDFEGNSDYAFVKIPFVTHVGNISDTPLEDKTAFEDQVLILGKKTDSNVILIDIREINLK